VIAGHHIRKVRRTRSSARQRKIRKSLQSVLENGIDAPIKGSGVGDRLVLRGIVNNDLCIFSHPEYGRTIRDRTRNCSLRSTTG
jgi:hypothetical protein